MSHIVDFDAGTSEQWVGWTRGNSDEAEAFVRQLGLAPELESGYLEAVAELESIVVKDDAAAAGLWYPDPTDLPWGQFTLRYVYPQEGKPLDPRALRRELRKAEKIPGTRVLDYSVAEGPIDLGRLVVQVEVRGFKDTGVVLSRIASTVFPAGSEEALRFEFQTNVPKAFAALGAESLTIVDSLTVELA